MKALHLWIYQCMNTTKNFTQRKIKLFQDLNLLSVCTFLCIWKIPLQNDPVFFNAQGQPISAQEAGYYNQEYDEYTLDQEAEELAARWEAGDLPEEPQWDQGLGYQQWADPTAGDIPYDNGYYQGYVWGLCW